MNFWTRYNINFSRAILSLTGHAKTSKNIGIIDMNDDVSKAFGIGSVFGGACGVVFGMFWGGMIIKSDFREAAIKAKVGEYDSQTGDFKYTIMDEDSSM